MKWLLAAAATVALAVVLARRSIAASSDSAVLDLPDWSLLIDSPGGDFQEEDQLPTLFEQAAIAMNPTNYLPVNVDSDTAARNVRSFLDMLAFSEGTDSAEGYRMLFGGALFDSFADHPRVYVPFRDTTSSAAGRYQILWRTWDTLRKRLALPDFSPASQDAAAIELIRERGALGDVQAGRLEAAIKKVAPIWASLPGAGYNQPERKLSQLVAKYQAAGGTVEA
jgi:lysozyme